MVVMEAEPGGAGGDRAWMNPGPARRTRAQLLHWWLQALYPPPHPQPPPGATWSPCTHNHLLGEGLREMHNKIKRSKHSDNSQGSPEGLFAETVNKE